MSEAENGNGHAHLRVSESLPASWIADTVYLKARPGIESRLSVNFTYALR